MQVNSRILFSAVKRISNDFPILKEARREVLYDLMDAESTLWLLDQVASGEIKIDESNNRMPSPFAFSLILEGYSDIIKIEDKQEFLCRMHQMVMAKISLNARKSSKPEISQSSTSQFSYSNWWEDLRKKQLEEKDYAIEKLKMQVWGLKKVPIYVKEELVRWISSGKIRDDILLELGKHKQHIEEEWPEELKRWVLEKMHNSS
jgi:hypothetical protein